MRTKAMRLCRLRGALGSSASASSSPSVHPGASSGLSAKPTSTEVLKPLQVLSSAGFGELRRPGVGFANLGATSCPASVRLLWAGRFGASCEKVEAQERVLESNLYYALEILFLRMKEELDNARPESAFRFQESESDGDDMSTEEVLVENASQGLFRMSNVIGDPDEPLTEEEKEKYTVKDHHGHKPHVEVASEIWSAKEQDGSNPFGDDSDKVHLREPNK